MGSRHLDHPSQRCLSLWDSNRLLELIYWSCSRFYLCFLFPQPRLLHPSSTWVMLSTRDQLTQ
ncbi:hypothetical protein BDR03DRAFT_954287 [Suillus americanus]|nr:hypothetical protein BDR03DRAFT_954287 [Suillus americanus]